MLKKKKLDNMNNNLQENYQQYYSMDESHWWFLGRKKILEFFLENYVKDINSHTRVVDLGCGSGTNIKNFNQIFNNIIGMEENQETIDLAKKATGKSIYKGELPDKIPFEQNSFDLAFLLDVLEHIEDDELSLKNINNVLAPNGYLLLSVPAFNFLWNAHDEMYGHKRRYTTKELTKKLNNNGFKVKGISYYNFLLFPIQAIIVFLKNKSIIKSKNNFEIMNFKALNTILKLVMLLESFLFKFIKPLYGASIIAIAKKC